MFRRTWQIVRDLTARYFVAGLLVFAPIGITIWAIASAWGQGSPP